MWTSQCVARGAFAKTSKSILTRFFWRTSSETLQWRAPETRQQATTTAWARLRICASKDYQKRLTSKCLTSPSSKSSFLATLVSCLEQIIDTTAKHFASPIVLLLLGLTDWLRMIRHCTLVTLEMCWPRYFVVNMLCCFCCGNFLFLSSVDWWWYIVCLAILVISFYVSVGVGKTCILTRLTKDKFDTEHNVTIGVEFGSCCMKVEDSLLKLQIWDTAG